jgi:hypothetical protein
MSIFCLLLISNPSSVLFFLINDKEPSDSVVAGHSSINCIFQFHSVLEFFGKKKKKKKLNEVETETRNIKTEQQNKSADVLKRFQSKALLCFPYLFMDQKPRLDTS